jgi:hypothetical protein
MAGSSALYDAALSSGTVSLPYQTDSEARCAPATATLRAPELAPNAASRLPFQLGLRTGVRVALPNIVGTSDGTDALIHQIATLLQVPPPSPPPIRHAAEEKKDFAEYVHADPQCIAASLSKTLGSRASALYRFGLFTGYAVTYRVAVRGADVAFEPELRFYAAAAGLPRALVDPLVSTAGAPAADALARQGTLQTQNIDDYLSGAGGIP